MAEPSPKENGEQAEEAKDTTLLSASVIGSPDAFSTAIKPPGSVFNSQPASDSSLLTHEILPHLSRSQTAVSGRFSLGGADESGNTTSLEDTSIAILDLDALQDSSEFLHSSEGLNPFLSGTSVQQPLSHLFPPSPPSPPSHPLPQRSTTTLPPAPGLTTDHSAVSGQDDSKHGMNGDGGLIPQKFLDRSSSLTSSSTSSVLSSVLDSDNQPSSFDGSGEEEASFDGESFEGVTTQQSNAGDREEKMNEEPQSLLQQQLELGAELSLKDFPLPSPQREQLEGPPASVHHHQQQQQQQQQQEEEKENATLQLKDLEVSPTTPSGCPGKAVAAGDDTLLADEVEPTVLFEAAVFSHYQPDDAPSGPALDWLEGRGEEETTDRLEPAVADTLEHTASFNEGLPSVYLAASATPTQTSMELLSPSPSQPDPAHPAPPPSGSSTTTSLDGSLVELAGSLGTSRESTVVPETPVVTETLPAESGQFSSGMYNPFDSDDNGDAREGVGELQFGEQSSDMFMKQLAQDEKEVERANLFAATPPSSLQMQSFDEVLARAGGDGSSSTGGGGQFTDSSGEHSISSYFQQRSHGLGQLAGVKLPPSMRPRFSPSTEHVIRSPADLGVTTPTVAGAPPPSGDGDETLVASDEGEGPADLAPPTTVLSRPPTATIDSLTPVITNHTPFPTHIPKLDLANTSTSFSPPPSTALPTLTSPSHHTSTANSTTIFSSPPQATTVTTEGRGGGGGGGGGTEELPSQYWRASETYSSTLLFPDVTALGFSPPPSGLEPFSSVATPSSSSYGMQLSSLGLFEVTATDASLPAAKEGKPPGAWSLKEENFPHETESVLSQSVAVTESSVRHSYSHDSSSSPSASASTSTLSSLEPQTTPPQPPPTVSIAASPPTSSRPLPSDQPQTPSSQSQSETSSPSTTSLHHTTASPPSSLEGPTTSPPPPPPLQPQSSQTKGVLPPSSSSSSDTARVREKGTTSPSTEAARKKLAELQAVLNATRFDADKFLASLSSKSATTLSELSTPSPSPRTEAALSPRKTATSLAATEALKSPPLRPYRQTPSEDTNPPLPSSPSHPPHSSTVHPSSKPIYTSPQAHPHTSPSRQLNRKPPGVSPSKRSRTPERGSLKLPDSLCFQQVCCVGAGLQEQLRVSNCGSRWLQLSFSLSQLYRDGCECPVEQHSVFLLPQRCFVGPEKTESVKVTFLAPSPGSYEAVLSVHGRLVVSDDSDTDQLCSSVILKALAETPRVEVTSACCRSMEQGTRVGEGVVLDYGVLVGGCSVSLPLCLANHGLSRVPLQLTVRTNVLAQMCFKFGEVPQSLVSSSSSSPPSHPHSPHTVNLTLPPRQTTQSKGAQTTIDLYFSAPKKTLDDSYDPGPPDEVSAQVEITVDGPNRSAIPIATVPIRAVVGVARLHVPRPLQALSFSCCGGLATTRDIPFKNAGNVPLQVRLKAPPPHFSVSPDSLLLEPAEEALVGVCFSPPPSSPLPSTPHSYTPLSSEGLLMIRVEPCGPNYEITLRGTATPTQMQRGGGEESGEGGEGGRQLLSCSRRSLYWGGVQLSQATQQKLVLHSSFPYKVDLQLSIRHHDRPFQLQALTGSGQVTVLPDEQLPVHVTFAPVRGVVSCTALDILDHTHNRKYRIPLCGYGGSGRLEVLGCRQSPDQESWVNFGEIVANRQAMSKLTVYNAGLRAMFVQATFHQAESSQPLSVSQASVTPYSFVLAPQQTRELVLLYQPSQSDERRYHAYTTTPVARLALVSGDEIIRQRLRRAFSSGRGGGGGGGGGVGEKRDSLRNPANGRFLATFLDQETTESSDLELGVFQVEDEERFFEQHLSTTTVVCLSGSPSAHRSEEPPPSSSETRASSTASRKILASPPLPAAEKQQQALRRLKLSPSHANPVSPPPPPPLPPPHRAARSPLGRSLCILPSHTLSLPDTVIGHYSEGALEIHNPYSQPLHWQLSSAASPFVRETARDSGDILKANYSVFWVSERTGSILPNSTAKALVIFQPHDGGCFSQLWDLVVTHGVGRGGGGSAEEEEEQKLRISFGGKATSTHISKPSSTLAKSEAPMATGHTPTVVRHAKLTPPRKSVYIKDEQVEFPPTSPGSKSTLKVRVCNRDALRYKFDVVRPSPPFSVDHLSFELGSRQCARLPVHFNPLHTGRYDGVVAVRTNAGHQAFAVLHGNATE